MEIFQIAPIWYPISSDITQGSIERVILYLDNEFTKKRNHSIVAASGDSRISGELFKSVPTCTSSSGLKYHFQQDKIHISKVLERILVGGIDIVCDHVCLAFRDEYLKTNIKTPFLTTIHGDDINKTGRIRRIRKLEKTGRNVYFHALSNSQKKLMENAGAKVEEVIYHGIPIEQFDFKEEKQNYLLWLGRVTDLKGTDLAIKLSQKSGIPLIIAGRVYPNSKNFYDKEIRPFLTYRIEESKDSSLLIQNKIKKNNFLKSLDTGERVLKEGEIIFLGPVDNTQKTILYKNARAFLMPNRWNEPFGLVMIEAMACGTPVIGTDRGAINELVEHGKTGFVIPFNNKDEIIKNMEECIENLNTISPVDCRRRVEENFTIEKEAENYLNLFRRIKNDTS